MPQIIAPTFGCILEPPDERDYRAELILASIDDKSPLPNKFRVSNTQPYTNQRHVDSCVGHAVAGAKSQQENTPLSPRHNWKAARELRGWVGPYLEERYGAYITDALKAVVGQGIPEYGLVEEDALDMTRAEYLNPLYTEQQLIEALKYKAGSYWRVAYSTSDIEIIKRALFTHDTELVTSMTWHSEFNRPSKGFLPLPKTKSYGHAFRCVGWGTKNRREYLIFANSWGVNWGDQGDFYIYTDQLHNYDLRGWYMFNDMPKDQALIINKYQGKVIKNAWDVKCYIVTNDHITWLETEKEMDWGRTKLWGEWHEIITVDDIEIIQTDKMWIA